MSMKALPRHMLSKHNCTRDNCLGHPKDYDNYIAVANKTKQKNKPSKTSRSQNSLHEKGQFSNQLTTLNKTKNTHKSRPSKQESKQQISQKSEVEQLRRHNAEISELLQQKNKKISDLKHKLKDSEAKIKQYESKVLMLQHHINQNQNPKSPITYQKPTENMLSHYQQQLKLLQNSQKATIESMEKYRLIEQQYHQYRNESERKVDRLMRENDQLRAYEPDKDYDKQITELKRQLNKLSEYQTFSPNRDTASFPLQNQMAVLRNNNRQLLSQRQGLLVELASKDERQKQLRVNLQAINRKVQRWGQQYRNMVQQKRQLQEKCDGWQLKYDQKKQKHVHQKQQWAVIFRQLMREVQKLKRQISRLQKSNYQLVNLYSEREQ